MKPGAPILCADVLAECEDGRLVFVERYTEPMGFALAGGKQEPGETAAETACREFREETGFTFSLRGILGIYDAQGRDPRGNYVSTVFYGTASGMPRAEPGKTRILLLYPHEIDSYRDLFVCDHHKIASDYLAMKTRG